MASFPHRGFECCLITDGTGATDEGNHAAAHKMVTMQHGVFGCIASSDAILKVLDGLPTNPMKLRPAWPQRPFRPLVLAPQGNLLTNTIAEAKPFPYSFLPTSVALLMIDWQNDFLDPRGFGASLGNDVSSLRRGVQNAKRLLELFRSKNLTIAHTLEAHTLLGRWQLRNYANQQLGRQQCECVSGVCAVCCSLRLRSGAPRTQHGVSDGFEYIYILVKTGSSRTPPPLAGARRALHRYA